MILDTIKNADSYFALHPGFEAAFAFLARPSSALLEPGRYEIDGDRVYATVFCGKGKGPAAPLEAHRSYIDIQYIASGSDVIGMRPLRTCRSPRGAYDAAKDIIYFYDTPESWLTLSPQSFVILYPDDAHAPLAGNAAMVKIIVKVKVE